MLLLLWHLAGVSPRAPSVFGFLKLLFVPPSTGAGSSSIQPLPQCSVLVKLANVYDSPGEARVLSQFFFPARSFVSPLPIFTFSQVPVFFRYFSFPILTGSPWFFRHRNLKDWPSTYLKTFVCGIGVVFPLGCLFFVNGIFPSFARTFSQGDPRVNHADPHPCLTFRGS